MVLEINSKKVLEEWEAEIKRRIDKHIQETWTVPILNIIRVGKRKDTELYVRNKVKKGTELGIRVNVIELPEDATQGMLNNAIYSCTSPAILQLPIPDHLDKEFALSYLHPNLDVDGLTVAQKGYLINGDRRCLEPATAKGVIRLIESQTSIAGKKVAILSRSELIGKPLTQMILQRDGYPIVMHSKVNYWKLKKEMIDSDIVVTGCGQRAIFTCADFKMGKQVIIDCSMARKEGFTGVGDIYKETMIDKNFKDDGKPSEVTRLASGYGHTGPATVLGLMENVIKSYEMRR